MASEFCFGKLIILFSLTCLGRRTSEVSICELFKNSASGGFLALTEKVYFWSTAKAGPFYRPTIHYHILGTQLHKTKNPTLSSSFFLAFALLSPNECFILHITLPNDRTSTAFVHDSFSVSQESRNLHQNTVVKLFTIALSKLTVGRGEYCWLLAEI